jgi:hypothetical protein
MAEAEEQGEQQERKRQSETADQAEAAADQLLERLPEAQAPLTKDSPEEREFRHRQH